ncbi:undecaprenyl diphosphate synthase [Fodinibius salinus]|uniref:Isoprenyl transferase n=1 Tax=Fodinibius salinus TaxID=860790 RepID=A0A5D3YGZ6_9BACT|nr:isoprenyl transferase [Fodinibius salinus]TYP92594.1 undecaprenyl diphosphate synthase [Fodinibius salinus]
MKPISLTNKEQATADKELQADLADQGEIPDHIAIIMDGNGRWAQNRGNLRAYGHKAGVNSVRDITEACAQIGVKYLTLYAFSTENWGRPKIEVNALMHLMARSLRKEAQNLKENNIKLQTIGQVDRFPKKCQRELREAILCTKENDGLHLCLALSYSGRWDITEAVKKISQRVKEGDIEPDEIDDETISAHLSTARIPDPELIIRTSGEYRLSNFLLWQLAYSELYITETYWPDFRRNELYKAIQSFQERDRRFGEISENNTKESMNLSVQELTS